RARPTREQRSGPGPDPDRAVPRQLAGRLPRSRAARRADRDHDAARDRPLLRARRGRRRAARARVRVVIAVVVSLAGGCRPATEPTPDPLTVAPSSGESRSSEPRPDPELEPAGQHGWTAAIEGSACGLTCADVYSCLLAEGDGRSAATIELGCLGACVRAPGAFASCERPRSITADQCASYLACARAAWPSEDRPATIVEPGPDGCGIACRALGRCRGFPLENAEECARQCRR